MREVWRDNFARNLPFTSFSRPFPGSGITPTIQRKTTPNAFGDSNPEIFYFEYDNVAFFGANLLTGDTYVTSTGPTDINAEFVEEMLPSDCSVNSIVIFSHKYPNDKVSCWNEFGQGLRFVSSLPSLYLHYTMKIYDVINDYFDVACGGTVLPILVITGNTHPVSYCMSKPDNRVFLTIEAFRSGPIKVTVVRSPQGEDFFYVEDSQLSSSNDECPIF